MQTNIAMKFAEYVVWILLCKHSQFGEEIYYNSRDIDFPYTGVTFSARPIWCYLAN